MKTEIKRHEGKLLLDYVATSGLSKKEFSDKLNISVPMLAYHCRKETFSGAFRGKLAGIGIALYEEEQAKGEFTEEYILELQEEIKLLNQVIVVQKQFIGHVTQNCKHGHCLNFLLDNRKS